MFRHVFLATDGSNHSQAAADLLLRLQWCADTNFEIFAVADKLAGIGHLNSEQARELVAGLEQRFGERFSKNHVRADVQNGNAHDLISRKVSAASPDLVVIGAHSKHGLSGFVLGNLMNKLVRETKTNLLVVRTALPPSGAPKIILCLANDQASEAVLQAVEGLVWNPDAKFMLLHVFPPSLTEYTPSPDRYRELTSEADTKDAHDTDEFLERCKQRLVKSLGVHDICTRRMEELVAGDAIIDICRGWQANLIVLGPSFKTSLDEFLLGNTAIEVCASAPCNVLVIRNAVAAAAQCGVADG